MAYETGTATDSNDLFAKFRTFITSHADLVSANQHWEELRYDVDDSNTAQLYLRGKGLSNSDSIYVNVWKFLVGADSFNWGFNGATGYFAANDYTLQPNRSGFYYCHFHNTTMTYWFFANGRRFIIVAKVGGVVFQSAYCGFILPYDLPTEYPYPLMINASSSDGNARYSWNGSNSHSSMDRGGYYSNAAIIDSGGAWGTIASYNSSTTTDDWFPVVRAGGSVSVYPYLRSALSHGLINQHLAAPGGDYLARPIILQDASGGNTRKSVFGQYDGVVNISGDSNAAENILTINSQNYIVFQNIYRTGIGDFFAVKQE